MKTIVKFLLLFPTILSAAPINMPHIDSIYDQDDREMISSSSNPKALKISKSVALIFNSDDLIKEQEQSIIFANLLEDLPPVGINICPDETFAHHHAYRAACTGFLIGKDLLASAGHCFETQSSCDNQLIAFDVLGSSESERGFNVDQKNIYRCKKIISQVKNRETLQDYAIIKLDRVTDRAPLKIRSTGKISLKDKVYMVGHPLGLAQVLSKPASINFNTNPLYFKTQMDSFRGNSGSPVINAKTQLVEGILVRGEEDFISDETNQCERYNKYSTTKKSDHLKGEGVTRIKVILPFIK